MEENKENSSSKHENSDLEGGISSIDNQHKHIEATGEAEDPFKHDKASGEVVDPLNHISGESDGSPNHSSGESEDPLNLDKFASEAVDPLDHLSGEAKDSPNHDKFSGEAVDPLFHISGDGEALLNDDKISGKVEDPPNNISVETEDRINHEMISGEVVLPLHIPGEIELKLDSKKFSGDASPTSFSSSSQLLEVDYDEHAFDVSFSISGEDGDIYNRQWSMVSTSPVPGPTSPENLQSPVVQVMERSDSYDPNRIPTAAFTRKSTNNTDWSADSNDSLFSIPMGKSGELNSASFLSRLPTVTETSEMDQKSVLGEIETHIEPPTLYADENEVKHSEMPSDSKTTSPPPPPTSPPPPPVPEENVAEETKSGDQATTPKCRCRCYNCFSCCTFCG